MLVTPIFYTFRPDVSSELQIYTPSCLFETFSWISLLICHPESLQLETQESSFIFHLPSSSVSTIRNICLYFLQSYASNLSTPLILYCCHVQLCLHNFSFQEPPKSSFCFYPCPAHIHFPQGHQSGILNNKLITYLSCLQFLPSFLLHME